MFSLFLHSKQNIQHTSNSLSGFGLIELMVSISIMALVSGIIFTRHNSFNSAVLLRSQAYEVALQVRDLQLNAVSSAYTGNSSEVFRESLGAYFETAPGSNGFFRIFRDLNSNGFPDTSEEFGQRGILDQRFEIRDVRVYDASGTNILTGTGLAVVFQRPNFDARFYDGNGLIVNALSAEIDVARKDESGGGVGVLRTIEVTSAGQISVKAED
jgi:prepilin-type N-terminal cleavage/methylation domain-containing protein